MIDFYNFLNETYEVFQHCKSAEEIDVVEKKMKEYIASQAIMARHHFKAGILLYQKEEE